MILCLYVCVCVKGVADESKSTGKFLEWEIPRDALLWEYQVISSDGGAAVVPGESIEQEVSREQALRTGRHGSKHWAEACSSQRRDQMDPRDSIAERPQMPDGELLFPLMGNGDQGKISGRGRTRSRPVLSEDPSAETWRRQSLGMVKSGRRPSALHSHFRVQSWAPSLELPTCPVAGIWLEYTRPSLWQRYSFEQATWASKKLPSSKFAEPVWSQNCVWFYGNDADRSHLFSLSNRKEQKLTQMLLFGNKWAFDIYPVEDELFYVLGKKRWLKWFA